jgi:hypothetical protein
MTQPGLTIVDAMNDPAVFAPFFPGDASGDTWWGWKVVLKGIYGLPMTEDEVAFFFKLAARKPPTQRVKEVWIIVGRRGGKDSVASVIVAYIAAMFSDQDHKLRPGERASVVCLATDRDQAKIILNYIRSYFTDIEMLREMVINGDGTASGFELENGVDVCIMTSSFRAVRGRNILATVLDECAFWRSDETSSNPDLEVYNAIVPGLASLGGMLIGISTPYARNGLLYKKYRDYYGKDSSVLVIKAPTRDLNPTIDQAIIDAAMEDDPAAARAEWMAEFRSDVDGWADVQLIEAAVDSGVTVRPPKSGVAYRSFSDPSGGSRDSFTVAIAHGENGTAVLDCLVEIKAPFNPTSATERVAETLKSYDLHRTTGDKYAAQWVVDAFAKCGITYLHSERDRSSIYLDVLPLFTSGRARLLDSKRLVSQFASLERRTSSVGKDRVDHGPGGHDDLCNSAAGAMVLAVANVGQKIPMVMPFYDGRPTNVPGGDYHVRRYG